MMKNVLGFALSFLLLTIAVGEAHAASKINPEEFVVGIQPIGRFRAVDIKVAELALKDFYGFKVKVFDALPMPKIAYYKPRRRHRADILLGWLRDLRKTRPCDIIVGLTSQDISVTKGRHKDWGIFGLGEVAGVACVISSHRLTRRLKKRQKKKGLERVVKVVLHEVGHVLGLGHCPTPRCVMNDAKGTIKTVDNETGQLSDDCRRYLEARFLYKDHTFPLRWDFWLTQALK